MYKGTYMLGMFQKQRGTHTLEWSEQGKTLDVAGYEIRALKRPHHLRPCRPFYRFWLSLLLKWNAIREFDGTTYVLF